MALRRPTLKSSFAVALSLAFVSALFLSTPFAEASHSWGGYHWARTTPSFTLRLGDDVSTAWDAYLATASADWSVSSVLDTTVVAGATNPKTCKAVAGRVEVCNSTYGNTGWLGVAQVWVSGLHITQASVKLNDTYFKTVTYNKPEWKQFVACQEIGHTFGLDHQDETFTNPNLGTCMDYTNDPSGSIYNQLSNLHPNLHDYDELALIYAHLDTFNSFKTASANKRNASTQGTDSEDASQWGKEIRKDSRGHSSAFERDLGKGDKVVTFVIWAE